LRKSQPLTKVCKIFGENDDQNWITKTLFILQPFSLTKTLCSKNTETLNNNRTPIFKDFLSFVEQKRLRQIYYRLHQNEVKIRELQARVDNLCSLLDKNLMFRCNSPFEEGEKISKKTE